MRTNGSDVLVAALENEGVQRIFALPGEENLAVVESLHSPDAEVIGDIGATVTALADALHQRAGTARHVQDLVRAQLPHHRRQHAAARQCAGDHGRRAAVGDHGEMPQPVKARARGLRRRRLHDLRQSGFCPLRQLLRRARPPGRVNSTLETAFKAGGVHLVAVPIDYSENMRVLVEELGNRSIG